jgi:hypothetical protein
MNHAAAAAASPLKLYTAVSVLYIYTHGRASEIETPFASSAEGLLRILFSKTKLETRAAAIFHLRKVAGSICCALCAVVPGQVTEKVMTLFVSATLRGSLKKHLACHSSVSMEAAGEEVLLLLLHASDKPCVTRVTLKIPRLLSVHMHIVWNENRCRA